MYIEDVPLVESMYLAFTCMPGESYRMRLGSLLLYSCDILRALINSLWLLTATTTICVSRTHFEVQENFILGLVRDTHGIAIDYADPKMALGWVSGYTGLNGVLPLPSRTEAS